MTIIEHLKDSDNVFERAHFYLVEYAWRCGDNDDIPDTGREVDEAGKALLNACKDAYGAIETLPQDVFGYASDPTVGEWPIRDELLHNIAKAIKKAGAA